MKRLFTFLVLLSMYNTILLSQSMGNYTFSSSATGSLEDMSSGTTSMLAASTYHDDVASTVQNIGFTFIFMGTGYTQFSCNSNGQMRLGGTAIGGSSQFLPVTNAAILAPMSNDNSIQTTGKIHFKTIGSAPNRKLVVEWVDFRMPFGTGAGTLSQYQVVLSEGTGVVEYRYGSMFNNNTSSAETRYVGMSSGNAVNQFGQVTAISTTPTYVSNATTPTTTSFPLNSSMAGLNGASQGSRTTFTFTPPATAPTDGTGSLAFSSVALTSMTLTWPAATGVISYNIYRSTDGGTTYTLAGSVTSATTTYNATGLTGSTTYTWKVAAANEGQESAGLTGTQATGACSISGVKIVGPTGDYLSFGAAFTALAANGLAGAVILEVQSTYDFTDIDTDPMTFTQEGVLNITNFPCLSSVNTLTIRPNAAGVVISGGQTTPLFSINGAQYVTFDGRVGSTGTTINMRIRNSNTANPALSFINGAQNNTIQYCTWEASNSTAPGNAGAGVISIQGGTTVPNSNNIITNCEIKDGLLTPYCLIQSKGISTVIPNANNQITNCKLYNAFRATATSTEFIRLDPGSTGFTIDNNDFYQTATRTFTNSTGTHYVINVTSGIDHFISNNDIGGNAPDLSGTYTVGGNTTYTTKFVPIQIASSTTPTTWNATVKGNRIGKISWLTNSATSAVPGIFTGIYVLGGKVLVGGDDEADGNTIGDMAGTGSITMNCAAAGTSKTYGIVTNINSAELKIKNNKIGGITTTSASASQGGSITPIHIASNPTLVTISNNTIGGDIANSINASNVNTSSVNAQQVRGIDIASSPTTATITNNIIRNLNNAATGTTTMQTAGIFVQGGVTVTVTDNTVTKLANATLSPGTGASTSVMGIGMTSSSVTNATVSRNTIHTLSNSSTAAVDLIGMFISVGTGTQVYDRNIIHSIELTNGTPGACTVTGIRVSGGGATSGNGIVLSNNMVQMGLKSDGTSLTGNHDIVGLRWTAGNVHALNNTFYVGGTGSSTANTFAMAYTTTGGNTKVQNNIFLNARTNASSLNGAARWNTAGNVGGANINNNAYNATGSSSTPTLIYGASTSYATLALWQAAATMHDAASTSKAVTLVTPNGSSSTVDLHLDKTGAKNCALVSAGANVSISTDYDNDSRTTATPTIGADEYPAATFETNFNTSIATTSAGTLTEGCFVNGWTYYQNGFNSNAFAVKWAPDGTLSNLNSTAKAAATVVIGLDGAPTLGGAMPNRVAAMKRFWNVTTSALDEPVNVRFFYVAAEKSEVTSVPTNSTFQWVKTVSGDYVPATNVTASGLVGMIPLSGTESMLNSVPYVDFTGVTSFSGGTGVGGEGIVLSVELKKITAYAKGKNNIVEWATASEKNMKEYIVERSVDGINGWEAIERKNAKNMNEAQYNTEDATAGTLSFYRVKSIELNGKEEVSKIVSVKRETKGKFNISKTYPNPSVDVVQIVFEATSNNKVIAIITDVLGRAISTQQIETVEGMNRMELNINALAKGMYILTLQEGGNVVTQRIVKK